MTNENMINDLSAQLPLFSSAALSELGKEISATYGFEWCSQAEPSGDLAFWLMLDELGLQLMSGGPQAPGPLKVEFAEGAHEHRRKFGGGAGQPVARAVGAKAGEQLTVLDATAGLGGDAYVLASLGCHVTLCERTALAAALLEDGLRRAIHDAEVGHIIQRMTLNHVDAHEFLAKQAPASFDVVFLDPMFPEKGKQAKAKKSMFIFQQLLSGDPDADSLLDLARRVAKKRVVVKRPKQAPFLAGLKPSGSQSGESTRFDLYAPIKP